MIPVKAYSIGDAHKQVVDKLLKTGRVQMTQDNEFTLEHLDMVIEITTPLAKPMVHPGSNFQGDKLAAYVDGLLNGMKGDFTYDYHSRLFEWGSGVVLVGDAREEELEINQFENIVEYLSKEINKDSRRAVMITWYPWKDLGYSGPCLQYVQFIIRDGKLYMTVLFRSNDGLSALGANMYALVHLQKKMADRLGLLLGGYCHHSVSMHAYVIRDQKEVEDLFRDAQGWSRKIVRTWLVEVRPDVPWKV